MTDYVVGFAMDNRSRIALIEKNRPEWQAGKLNGIGGHVEKDENPWDAMRREFCEETGVDVPIWGNILKLRALPHNIYFYRSFVDSEVLDSLRSVTDERVVVHSINWVLSEKHRIIPNLQWIIPLAAYTHDEYAVVEAFEL